MAMDVGGTQGGPKSDINVTPLVDVKLPEAGNTVDKPENQEQTVVAVDSANRFWVNGVQVAKHEFADRVKATLEDRSDRVVLIKGDQDASYGAIMEAMDYLHEAQIEDIGLITDPRKDQQQQQVGGN